MNLGGVRSPTIGFDRSSIVEELNLNSAVIDGPLDLRDAGFRDIDLRGATVGGNLELDGSTLTGKLNANGGTVKGSLFLRRAQLEAVDLAGGQVSGSVETDSARVFGEFNLNSVRVGGPLYLRDATFTTVSLVTGNVTGVMELYRSRFSGPLTMNGTNFASSLILAEATLPDIAINSARVEGSITFRASMLGTVSLRNSRIGQELRLATDGEQQPTWVDGGFLDLRSTSVGAVDDSRGAWPASVSLAGFTYETPRGSTSVAGDDLASRSTDWYLQWLRKNPAYRNSGQPFLQLEKTLREAGRRDVANKLAIERRTLELPRLPSWRQVVGRAHMWTVGFGYEPERAIWWILGLLVIGVLAVWRDPTFLAKCEVRSRVLFSADQIIPLVKFRKKHGDADLQEMKAWVRWVFYGLKAVEYVLAAFLISAIGKVTAV